MRYSPLAVANYFIEKARLEGEPLDHLKLQKLVYIAHGWHLAIYGRPLLKKPVQAWTYGPVVPELYHQLKRYGNQPIASPIIETSGFKIAAPQVDDEDRETLELLRRVWRAYKGFTGVRLSNFTHEDGTPWDLVWKEAQGRRNVTIPDELIEEHFRELAGEEAASA